MKARKLLWKGATGYRAYVVNQPKEKNKDDLTFREEPVEVLDRKVKTLRTKTIPMVKVLWKYYEVGEATWETKEQMRKQYPQLFNNSGMNFEDEIL